MLLTVWTAGKENDLMGETRAGECCPDMVDDSLLMVRGDGRDWRSPLEARRWIGRTMLLKDNRGHGADRDEGNVPPVSERPSSIM